MYRQDTGEIYDGYKNENPDMVKNAEWRCDSAKLKALVDEQKDEVAFYCGVASNMDDIIPLFTKVLLLHVSSELLRQRLLSRDGTEEFGGTEEVRQQILGWKDWWEDEMRDRGAIQIDASGDVVAVADKIVANLELKIL